MSKEKNKQKGDVSMNAYAIKPNMPFVTKNILKRTPATKENKAMVEYMDSHDFSFQFDEKTGEYQGKVIDKNEV